MGSSGINAEYMGTSDKNKKATTVISHRKKCDRMNDTMSHLNLRSQDKRTTSQRK